MKVNVDNHPCFNVKAKHTHIRVHLPVAPKCNVQCNFCNRKFDCVNEGRPGVTSAVLSPEQALAYLDDIMIKRPVSVVGIAGPGDPFANPEETMETLRLIREKYPEILLCVSSNGMNIYPYIDELAELEVSHVTITVNGVDPDIVSKVYRWVRHNKKVYRGISAGDVVVAEQMKVIRALKKRDIIVKVNSIIIPTINDHHIVDVAKKVSAFGVEIFNPIPLIPTEDTEFGSLHEPEKEIVHTIKQDVARYISVMHHCTRCRADAAGLLGEDNTKKNAVVLQKFSSYYPVPDSDRPYVAVASIEGVLINLHLGEAKEIGIYHIKDGSAELVETRSAPEKGCGDERWKRLAGILHDCRYLLVSGVGDRPRKELTKYGLTIGVADGIIDEALHDIYGGKGISHLKKTPERSCGGGCAGANRGVGCG